MIATAASPLVTRGLDGVIGWLHQRPLTCREFLATVHALADELPEGPLAINLCRDRMHFLIGFCAVIIRGQCNLLLPNKRHASIKQSQVHAGPGQSYVLHDQCDGADFGLSDETNLAKFLAQRPKDGWSMPADIPSVPMDQPCVTTFTSGTTGQPASVHKSWRTIVKSSQINISPYLADKTTQWQLLATVPPQHMYGLESSIFLPLMANVQIHSGRPLLPADVSRCLAEMDSPRLLITTPAHLRALVAQDMAYPRVARLVSATAPLDPELAAAASTRFDAEVREIYGCSEAGSLASRSPLEDEHWRLFDGFSASCNEQGFTQLMAPHLPGSVTLNDRLTWLSNTCFSLGGRSGDQVNVAGKRGSLQALTQTLLNIPGVTDGAIFEVPEAIRLAALVVAPGLSARQLRLAMREHVDDLLVPRPLLLVEALPRTATGKLPQQALLDLYEQQR